MEQHLTTISAEERGVTAKVTKIISMDGDVDVSQRKGKVITLFDVKLQLEYSGKVERLSRLERRTTDYLSTQAARKTKKMSVVPSPFQKSPTTRRKTSMLYVYCFST